MYITRCFTVHSQPGQHMDLAKFTKRRLSVRRCELLDMMGGLMCIGISNSCLKEADMHADHRGIIQHLKYISPVPLYSSTSPTVNPTTSRVNS